MSKPRNSTASTKRKRRASNLRRGLLTPKWAGSWAHSPLTATQRRRRAAAKRARASRKANR